MRSEEEMLADLTPEELSKEQERVRENMKEFNKEFSPIDDFEKDQLKEDKDGNIKEFNWSSSEYIKSCKCDRILSIKENKKNG